MANIAAIDGVRLRVHEWSCDDPVVAIVLLHGYGEHAQRYDHVARAFCKQGISTYGVDFRGHGLSAGPRGHIRDFRDYHKDVDALLGHVQDEVGELPVILLAHSMGGLVALDWVLARSAERICGMILSSPLLGLPRFPSPMSMLLVRFLSVIVPRFPLPTRLRGDVVTRDPLKCREYDADSLNFSTATPRWVVQSLTAIRRVTLQAQRIELPLLLLYAGDDKVVSADATEQFARRLGGTEQIRLAGYFHEILNAPPRDRDVVINRMAQWSLGKAAPRTC